MNDEIQAASTRGRWVVIALIVLGLIAAAFAATYWRGVLDRTAQNIKAKDVSWKKQAREELATLQDIYTNRRQEGSVAPMIDAARELVARYPKLDGAHVLLGQMLLDAGKYKQGLKHLQDGLALNDRQSEVHLLAGNTALMIDDVSAAERHISKAIGLDQTNGKLRLHMAQIHLRRREHDEARMSLLEALKLDSSLHEAYSGLSDLYARKNKLDLALQQINKAIDRCPEVDRRDWAVYIRKKARLLRRANKGADALRVLEALSARERIDPDVMHEAALCHAMLGKPDQAAKLYEQALFVLPLDVRLLEGAVRWHHKAGHAETAQRHLRSLRKVDPDLKVIEELERLFKPAASQN